jgi:hypothetical protein
VDDENKLFVMFKFDPFDEFPISRSKFVNKFVGAQVSFLSVAYCGLPKCWDLQEEPNVASLNLFRELL